MPEVRKPDHAGDRDSDDEAGSKPMA